MRKQLYIYRLKHEQITGFKNTRTGSFHGSGVKINFTIGFAIVENGISLYSGHFYAKNFLGIFRV